MFKICTKCKKKKDQKDFNKARKRKDGSYSYRTECKKCHNKYTNERNLITGKVKRKRSNPIKNLIGKKFGLLLVIKHLGTKYIYGKNKHMWLCECDCGIIKPLMEQALKSGGTKSCGCLNMATGNKNKTYRGYEKISGSLWSKIKQTAKKRNLEFDITIKYAWNLYIQQNKKCKLSKLDIIFAETAIKHNNGFTTASLDRIDSSKGYVEGNVQWLHKHINQMKWNHNENKFIELCHLVSNNLSM